VDGSSLLMLKVRLGNILKSGKTNAIKSSGRKVLLVSFVMVCFSCEGLSGYILGTLLIFLSLLFSIDWLQIFPFMCLFLMPGEIKELALNLLFEIYIGFISVKMYFAQ